GHASFRVGLHFRPRLSRERKNAPEEILTPTLCSVQCPKELRCCLSLFGVRQATFRVSDHCEPRVSCLYRDHYLMQGPPPYTGTTILPYTGTATLCRDHYNTLYRDQ
ncbi:unnamed protein product, partial [Ectocarpus sp. 8 AP-2014]